MLQEWVQALSIWFYQNRSNMIYLITGGERSGKSRYAQELALQLSNCPMYLATARKWDSDFEKRIARHQSERDQRWINLEEEKFISRVGHGEQVVLLDCITLWLTNIFSDNQYDVEAALRFAKGEWIKVRDLRSNWILVTNEIGMGVHAATETGRKFVELQGWVNQFLAEQADHVYLMVSGIPLAVKQPKI
jgi:adenosylcobinamide kinase/adenosylcobinamide-phosphate guanylyltransferase